MTEVTELILFLQNVMVLKYLTESGLFIEFIEFISYDPPQIHWHNIATVFTKLYIFLISKYILNR